MENSPQETSTEPVQLSLTDENISQADYERLRNGETIEVEKSAPAAKADAQATSETVDESETSETDGDEDESDESLEMRPKKKSGTQRRIEKLVKQRSEAEREADLLRRENEALKAQGKPAEPKVEAKLSAEGEPNADDFESAADFYKAHAKWAVQEELKAEKAEAEKKRLVTERSSRVETHNKKVDEYRKEHPDFDKHLSNFFEEHGTDFHVSTALEETLTDSDFGPAILHELVKDPEEFERINSLGAMGVARAIGRLEEKLSATVKSKPKEDKPKTTKAPPPAKPISTSSANGKKSVYDDDISQAEYERIRAEQEKRRAIY